MLVYAFEDTGAELEFMPLAARRALDVVGRKLSLEGWQSLAAADRTALVDAGTAEAVDAAKVAEILLRAAPVAKMIDPVPPPDPTAVPHDVISGLGILRQVPLDRWAGLRNVDRYVLDKLSHRPEKLARAHDEIVGAPIVFAHLGESGEARMVDVAAKAPTSRRAVAGARVRMTPAVLARIVAGEIPKGDVFAAARIAGIQAAKRTPDLIPLCHQIALTRVEVIFEADRAAGTIAVRATAEAFDRTGVEMEALVAASVASLTIYDMVKSADRWVTIDDVALLEKSGGRSGDVRRPSGAR